MPLPFPFSPHPLVRPGKPVVRTTFQFTGTIDPATVSSDTSTVFQKAIAIILGWCEDKIPAEIPESAWDGSGFLVELPGQKVEAVPLDEAGFWTLRIEQLDAPFMGRKAVPGRVWSTEIALHKTDAIAIGVRIHCASLPYSGSQDDFSFSRPHFLVELADNLGLSDAQPLLSRPWIIENGEDIEALYKLVVSPERKLPVVVLTAPDRKTVPANVRPFVMDEEELTKRAQCVAHVACLPWDMAFQWTDRVGKDWSAFMGAVRTYWPGLNFDTDSPRLHPRVFADKILFWQSHERKGEAAFLEWLMDELFSRNATRRINWQGWVFVTDARVKAAELARERVQKQVLDTADIDGRVAERINRRLNELNEAHQAEIDAMREKIAQSEKEAEAFSNEAMEADRVRDHYLNENEALRRRSAALQYQLEAKTNQPVDQTIAAKLPESYGEIADWANANLVGRLVLHPRANRGLKEAEYESVETVCRTMLLLAHEYRNMRMGLGTKEAFDEALNKLHLHISNSISEERAAEFGDAYYVPYPIGFGQKRFLEVHLRNNGNSRDCRRCLAVYFFWDADSGQVVVGWLPGHLENRLT